HEGCRTSPSTRGCRPRHRAGRARTVRSPGTGPAWVLPASAVFRHRSLRAYRGRGSNRLTAYVLVETGALGGQTLVRPANRVVAFAVAACHAARRELRAGRTTWASN